MGSVSVQPIPSVRGFIDHSKSALTQSMSVIYNVDLDRWVV